MSFATLHTFYHHLKAEDGRTLFVAGLFHTAEFHLHTVLLGPLQQFRLEVDLFVGHLVDVDHLSQDAFLHKPHHGIVALVQIDGTDQCLEGVAGHVTVVRPLLPVALYQFRQSHLCCQFAQRLTADQFRAGVGQKPLTLAFEMLVDDMSHHSIQQGVAKKLQPLVVQRLAFLVAPAGTLVGQGRLIVTDVAGIEPDDVVERRKKLLLLAEREP